MVEILKIKQFSFNFLFSFTYRYSLVKIFKFANFTNYDIDSHVLSQSKKRRENGYINTEICFMG